MARPITWQNVGSSGATASGTNLFNNGVNQINQATAGLTNLMETQRQQNITNQNTLEADNNASIANSVNQLNMDQWGQGPQSQEALDQQYGADNYDFGKYLSSYNQRDNTLMDEHTTASNYSNTLQAEADKPLVNAFKAQINSAKSPQEVAQLTANRPEGVSEGAWNEMVTFGNTRANNLNETAFTNELRQRGRVEYNQEQSNIALHKKVNQQLMDFNGQFEGSTTEYGDAVGRFLDKQKGLTVAERDQYKQIAKQSHQARYDLKGEQKVVFDQQQVHNQESLDDLTQRQDNLIRGLSVELGYPQGLLDLKDNPTELTREMLVSKYDDMGDSGLKYSDAETYIEKAMNSTANPAEIDYIITQAKQGDYGWFNSNDFEVVKHSINTAIEDYKKLTTGKENAQKRKIYYDTKKQQKKERNALTDRSLKALTDINSKGRKANATDKPFEVTGITSVLSEPQTKKQDVAGALQKILASAGINKPKKNTLPFINYSGGAVPTTN